MNKQQQQAHEARVIETLNRNLFLIEMRLREGTTGKELQHLETARIRIQTRLMGLYGTQKYGLITN